MRVSRRTGVHFAVSWWGHPSPRRPVRGANCGLAGPCLFLLLLPLLRSNKVQGDENHRFEYPSKSC